MANLQGTTSFDIGNNWNPDITFEPWDFETDFWERLGIAIRTTQ
jgi:hypothetical protein